MSQASRALTFGLQIPQFAWPGGPGEIGPRLRNIAQPAEAAGFDTLWVMDHVRQIPQLGPSWHVMLESWTALAHLAACTSTIRLGTLVSALTHRHVTMLGKIVAIATKVRVLRQHCAAAGRDPATISVSHLSSVLVGDDHAEVDRLVEATRPPKVSVERHRRVVNAGTVDQHLARIDRYVEAGVDQVIVSLADLADLAAVDRSAAVIATARAARAART